ncbi:hypothetical protein ACNJX9_35925 [Bradyrhizobium sp. DASA03076]|uniref:hypothetical protein n=1 Tax=Bradyrhizobium TaxID=374 RepID=UPI0012ED0873|nr:hypothetical protein [Bradyrhizobium manausense]
MRLDFIIFWLYTPKCAVVVVEGAVATLLSGTTTVLALGLALNLVGLGLLFWLTVALAVYALPFFVAVSAAAMALDHGSGIIAALTVAIVSAALTLAIAQFAHSMTRLITVRGVIGAVFAFPAGIAGFHLMLALSRISVSSPFWCEAFAYVGATFIAGKAWMQITLVIGPGGEPATTNSASTVSDRRSA